MLLGGCAGLVVGPAIGQPALGIALGAAVGDTAASALELIRKGGSP
jgi:hypothetical protein